MAFQAVPQGALIVVQGTLDGQEVVNTLGFSWGTPGLIGAAALQSITTGLADYWGLNMLPLLPAQYTMGVVTGRVLDQQGGPIYEETGGVGATGGRAGNLLPNNCSLVISFRTGLGGATNRGRNYWCGLLEADVTGSLVNAVYAGNVATMYNDMVGASQIEAGWTWSVISRKELIPAGPGRAVPITTAIMRDLRVDSQRRRLP